VFFQIDERGRGMDAGERSLGESHKDPSGKEPSEDLVREIRRLAERTDQRLGQIKDEIGEMDERNRRAYESLSASIKPDRKEWTLIAGGAGIVAVLLVALFLLLSRSAPHPGPGKGETGLARPDQMGEKDRYVYFVGRWYLGVRDRMSTSERKFLENYLKPFDNIDSDLKARKEAGL